MAMIKININDLEKLIMDLNEAMSYIGNDKSNINKILEQLVSNFPSDNYINEISFKVENELRHIEELSSLLNEAFVYLISVHQTYLSAEKRIAENIANSFK